MRPASFAGGVRPPTRGSRLGNAIRCQGSTRSSHSRRRRRRASPARARSGLGQARRACEQDPHAQGPEHRPHAGWPRGGLYRARRGAHAASRGSGNATPSRRLSASWRRAARKRRSSPSRGEPDLGKRRRALAFQVVGDGGFRRGRSRPCALPTGGRGGAPRPLCASYRGARPILERAARGDGAHRACHADRNAVAGRRHRHRHAVPAERSRRLSRPQPPTLCRGSWRGCGVRILGHRRGAGRWCATSALLRGSRRRRARSPKSTSTGAATG